MEKIENCCCSGLPTKIPSAAQCGVPKIGENNLCATEKHQQPTPIKEHPETICGQMGQKLKFLAKKKKEEEKSTICVEEKGNSEI